MGISKIALAFVILGLAYCSGYRYCSRQELVPLLDICKSNAKISIDAAQAAEDLKKACSAMETFKSCVADVTNGCLPAIGSAAQRTAETMVQDLSPLCKKHGYSHASSTSVGKIVLLITALATLVPFTR